VGADTGWQTVTIADIAEDVFDGPHATPKESESGPIFLGISSLVGGRLDVSQSGRLSEEDFARWTRRVTPSAGDLVFSYETRLGEAAVIPEGLRCCLGRRMALIRPNRDVVDPRFLLYAYLGPSFQETLRRFTVHGSTVDRLPLIDFPKFPIEIPPLIEQRAIAGVLGALDDKIESNRRAAGLLEALIETEYLDATSGAPDSPYSTVLAVQMGSPFFGGQFSEPGVGRPLIRIRDLKSFDPQVWTTESRPDEISVSRGDVLVGMDAEFRSTLWLGADGVLNQRMCRFVPQSNVGTAFAWFSIRADLEFCERAKSGTTVIHLNKSDIERFRVPHLSEEAHHAFYLKTQPMVERLVSLGLESQLLADLRDALLPELLSGRLRVREAEEMVGSV
jgi:type I restriction enzyme S subunit